MKNTFPIFAILLAAVLLVHRAAANDYFVQSSSYVGTTGDTVEGVGIQADGTIVVAANVQTGPLAGDGPGGVMARLSPDGQRVVSLQELAAKVRDLAMDGHDNLFVAADADGVIRLPPDGRRVIWKKDIGGNAARVDAAMDGHCAVLSYGRDDDTKTGAGEITVLSPDGKQIGRFPGHRNTLDLCIDSKSRTVIHIGWRQASAHDGKRKYPVQIAYIQGRSYAGEVKYTLYDWPTDREAPGFLNRETNNMADTRGYRCAMGRDGLLYAAFECAGGNHIFRWEPKLTDGRWTKAGGKKPKGDKYHAFYNSRAEHKLFMARYRPATGEYLLGQEFCTRLSSGRANAVRVKRGAIAASEAGIVLAGGASASNLPVTFLPPETGDYKGGSYLLAMNPELTKRLYCTRFQPGGTTHAVDARRVGENLVVVAGGSNNRKKLEAFWTKNALQSEGPIGCGFLVVLSEEP